MDTKSMMEDVHRLDVIHRLSLLREALVKVSQMSAGDEDQQQVTNALSEGELALFKDSSFIFEEASEEYARLQEQRQRYENEIRRLEVHIAESKSAVNSMLDRIKAFKWRNEECSTSNKSMKGSTLHCRISIHDMEPSQFVQILKGAIQDKSQGEELQKMLERRLDACSLEFLELADRLSRAKEAND